MRIIIVIAFQLLTVCSFAQNFYLFVGTYTQKDSKGVYVYRFNAADGTTELVSNTDSAANPSYIAIAPNGETIYAVNETDGEDGGKVSAYGFEKNTGRLTLINQQSTGGDHPCYVTVDKGNNWAVVANYSGGSTAAFPINKDGSLSPYDQLIQNTGNSANTKSTGKSSCTRRGF